MNWHRQPEEYHTNDYWEQMEQQVFDEQRAREEEQLESLRDDEPLPKPNEERVKPND